MLQFLAHIIFRFNSPPVKSSLLKWRTFINQYVWRHQNTASCAAHRYVSPVYVSTLPVVYYTYPALNPYCQAATGWNQLNYLSEAIGDVSYFTYVKKMKEIGHKNTFFGIFCLIVALAGTYKYSWRVMG